LEPVRVQASNNTLETGASGTPQTIPVLAVEVVASLAVTFSKLTLCQMGVVLVTVEPVSVAGLEGTSG
jgi:hypothetical protein